MLSRVDVLAGRRYKSTRPEAEFNTTKEEAGRRMEVLMGFCTYFVCAGSEMALDTGTIS